jgi:hypothetical protein
MEITLNSLEIKNKAKIIKNARGKSIKVILPIDIFNELLEITIGQEIYEDKSTQKSIKKAKKDISLGNIKTFSYTAETINWLKN